MNDTVLAETRRKAIAEAVERVREIEATSGVTREGLAEIEAVLHGLAGRDDLFDEDVFPRADDVNRTYLLSEDDDRRFALYLVSTVEGFSTPPHDHTTWAVIVGLDGQEENRVFRRTDDGSRPGRGTVEETARKVVERGSGICFLPDDIHAIRTVGARATRHFHMYGRSLEDLPDRVVYDTEAGTYRVFAAPPGILKPEI